VRRFCAGLTPRQLLTQICLALAALALRAEGGVDGLFAQMPHLSSPAVLELLASLAWSVKGLPDDAMKPLYLCYDDLPCHLKQCFLYCSMFPSDLGVDRHVLVQRWISEGFVRGKWITRDNGGDQKD
jgi:hypothetical protein